MKQLTVLSLLDVRDAAIELAETVAGKTFEDYQNDRPTRRIV